ncbi:YugN family protein [Peribacillus asahii]|uniref:YugN family protein n=1 Tax=Peribacillus asahii TaxID=228899 RepID=UPI002079FA45|nr:YugN family protein [Peribacillus asahii]USK71525.1 YugN-like family protein [Peribacillus asahii]
MRLENSGLHHITADLNRLDDLMPQYGLIRAEQWDYERVSYDRKFELTEGIYYLRILGEAIEGDVGSHKAIIKLRVPLLGKHYYPHGVEYGDGEYFPAPLVKQCEKILADVHKELVEFNGL